MEQMGYIDNSYAYNTVCRARDKERPKAHEFAENIIKNKLFCMETDFSQMILVFLEE